MLKEYLQEMGGELVEENLIQGAGWIVRLSRMDPYRIGSLVIGQTRLEIQIEDDLVDVFFEMLSKKTLRAGG